MLVVLVLIRLCWRLADERDVVLGGSGWVVVLEAACCCLAIGVVLRVDKEAGDGDLGCVALDVRFMLSVELFSGVTVPGVAGALARTTRPLRIWR